MYTYIHTCVRACSMTPYNISSLFMGQMETGVFLERDNPWVFHFMIKNTLRPLLKGHILQCLLCTGTVPWPVVTLLATNLSISVCIHTTFLKL